jgi:hypothetical protein
LLIYEESITRNVDPFSVSVEEFVDTSISPTTTATTATTTDSGQVDLLHTRVLLDSFHAMKRITDTIPANHQFKGLFSQRLRDAMFIVDSDDKANVDRVLREKGTTFENHSFIILY